MGRIAKWGASSGDFDIQYRPRTSIKGQVLEDFVAEFTLGQLEFLQIEGSKIIKPWERMW